MAPATLRHLLFVMDRTERSADGGDPDQLRQRDYRFRRDIPEDVARFGSALTPCVNSLRRYNWLNDLPVLPNL
jgi:hypothetical protein